MFSMQVCWKTTSKTAVFVHSQAVAATHTHKNAKYVYELVEALVVYTINLHTHSLDVLGYVCNVT